MKYFSISLFLLFISFSSHGFVFRVLGVSGKVKIKSGDTETLVKAGNSLHSGQTIVIESGYCGLLHAKGKTVDLKKPGIYAVEELDKKFGSAPGTKAKVSEKYLDYIMGQLSKKDADDMEKSVRKYMEVPGAVERSGSDSKKGLSTARVYAFPNNEVFADRYTISWEAVKGVKSYRVELTNRFDEMVESVSVEGNKMELDFRKYQTPESDSYTLTVNYEGPDTVKMREYQFKISPKESVEIISEEASSTYMLNGILCEEKHFYLDAIRYYEMAVKAEPEVSTYSEALNSLKSKLAKL